MPFANPSLRMQDFSYDLPSECVPEYPLPDRAQARMLVYQEGEIQDRHFYDLPDFLGPQHLIVLNDTKVVPARLLFQRPTGARIEIFCLEPLAPVTEIQQGLKTGSGVEWECLVGNAKKWKLEEKLVIETPELCLSAHKLEALGSGYRIRFNWEPAGLSFAEVLEAVGRMPLPPYLRRPAEAADRESYQTVFAEAPGAVAAPTAGLHFTPQLLKALETKGVSACRLTLHVGAGTFRPVSAERAEEHEMHTETLSVSREALAQILKRLGNVVAVGTTALRTLESLYWHGVALLEGRATSAGKLSVTQWEPYVGAAMRTDLPSPQAAIKAILDGLEKQGSKTVSGRTALMIVPGYKIQMASGLITNFHQPQSTLLLLVAAFVGSDWRRIYDYALSHDFRFFSYGDGSLLWRAEG